MFDSEYSDVVRKNALENAVLVFGRLGDIVISSFEVEQPAGTKPNSKGLVRGPQNSASKNVTFGRAILARAPSTTVSPATSILVLLDEGDYGELLVTIVKLDDKMS